MTKREYQAADYAAELNENEQEANDVKIADVELSTRAKTALKKIKVQTLRQLAQIDENSIKGCHNGLGLKTFEELKKLLEKNGLSFGMKKAGLAKKMTRLMVAFIKNNDMDPAEIFDIAKESAFESWQSMKKRLDEHA